MAAVESIPCPRCSAAPGQVCTTPGGVEIPTGHASRWVLLFAPKVTIDKKHNLG